MVDVDLYAEDGRLLWRVRVPLPQPPVVHYAGELFEWSIEHQQYRRRPRPTPWYAAVTAEGG